MGHPGNTPDIKPLTSSSSACLRAGKFLFRCVLEDDALLPPFKGSTFRGVFGHALKRTVCALKIRECGQCPLAARCLYVRVFDKSAQQKGPGKAANAIRPYVIEPPETQETELAKGAPLDFHLTLFGDMCEELPYFVHAFVTMGEMGIGKRVNGRRARFSIESVHLGGRTLYQKGGDLYCTGLGERIPEPRQDSAEQASALRIMCRTPLRLKFENRLQADLPFHVLIRAALRRVSSLFETFGSGEPALDYRGLVARAQGVECTENRLSWFDWQRYSQRQEQKMLMGGITGEAVYGGDLGEFLPLLRLAELFHLGKQTTFGLGKVSVEELR